MVVNLSGRGDKDIPQVADILRGKKIMITRIDARFAELKQQGRAAFVTPSSWPATRTPADFAARSSRRCRRPAPILSRSGCPLTDPMADGPSIQAAGLRAPEGGNDVEKDSCGGALVSPGGLFATPLVLMGLL